MAKIPYLVRRKNVFYFCLGVPVDLREVVKSREIFQSLRTQNSDEATRRALKLAAHFKTLLHDIKTGKRSEVGRFDALEILSGELSAASHQNIAIEPIQGAPSQNPVTALVIAKG